METQIKEIFKTRDKAVSENNQELLVSTQVGEIPKSGSEGYLKTEKITSTVLYTHNDDKDSRLWIAVVQEDYFFEGNFSHRGYLLYKMIEQDGELLISEIVW